MVTRRTPPPTKATPIPGTPIPPAAAPPIKGEPDPDGYPSNSFVDGHLQDVNGILSALLDKVASLEDRLDGKQADRVPSLANRNGARRSKPFDAEMIDEVKGI